MSHSKTKTMNANKMPELPKDKVLIESGRLTKLGDQLWSQELNKWVDCAEGILIGFTQVVVRPRANEEEIGLTVGQKLKILRNK